jgi:ethanolamine utilization protein EutQ (cupin superfamily)
MEFSDNVNYVVLSNNVDKKFMSKFGVYQIIDVLPFEKLKNNLEMFPSKRVIFNESLSSLSNKEKKEIFDLLDKQNINYVNVTSNIEDALFGDYIIVYDEDMKVLEGNKEVVLKNEKLLKKLGFGVPFVVDLSIQLMYYDILDKVYFDVDNLLEALWN